MPQSAELRRQIEDLALRLVIGEPENGASAADWMPALERIRQHAQRERADDVVRAADAFIDALRVAGGPGVSGADGPSGELQEGIARLQQAVEIDSQRVAAGTSCGRRRIRN